MFGKMTRKEYEEGYRAARVMANAGHWFDPNEHKVRAMQETLRWQYTHPLTNIQEFAEAHADRIYDRDSLKTWKTYTKMPWFGKRTTNYFGDPKRLPGYTDWRTARDRFLQEHVNG